MWFIGLGRLRLTNLNFNQDEQFVYKGIVRRSSGFFCEVDFQNVVPALVTLTWRVKTVRAARRTLILAKSEGPRHFSGAARWLRSTKHKNKTNIIPVVQLKTIKTMVVRIPCFFCPTDLSATRQLWGEVRWNICLSEQMAGSVFFQETQLHPLPSDSSFCLEPYWFLFIRVWKVEFWIGKGRWLWELGLQRDHFWNVWLIGRLISGGDYQYQLNVSPIVQVIKKVCTTELFMSQDWWFQRWFTGQPKNYLKKIILLGIF